MKVLVTGAYGFIGSNLCESLSNIANGKDQRARYQSLAPITVYKCGKNSTEEELDRYCKEADFVFNLAGVNRSDNEREFARGNVEFTRDLIARLERCGNKCPMMLSSSIWASLDGRYADSPYGKTKLEAEGLVADYGRRAGVDVFIFRFPNVYGKWCQPNYNSVVATFCYNISRNLPITINNESVELELLYIDDLVGAMLELLLGNVMRSKDGFCVAPTNRITLGNLVNLLTSYKESRAERSVPLIPDGSLEKKLFSTYESYLDPFALSYELQMHMDNAGGGFMEFIRTPDRGQISVNVSKPGCVKGQHWHHSKWEKFLVVSGEALIQLRRIGVDGQGNQYPVVEYRVSGEDHRVVEMIPGYTHNLINLSERDDLITLIWANESFDASCPDTYREEV